MTHADRADLTQEIIDLLVAEGRGIAEVLTTLSMVNAGVVYVMSNPKGDKKVLGMLAVSSAELLAQARHDIDGIRRAS